MASKRSRREFLQTTAVTGVGFFVAAGFTPKPVRAANEKIAFASIGVSGKGGSDSHDAGSSGDMVAICDVDDKNLDNAAKKYPGAKKFNDFRKMLDEMGKSIDAVTVSTPDHIHAPASLMAMRMKKHCFCQKPLTHSIYEARLMAETAKEMKVATQMGNQGTAGDSLRRAAAMLRAGAVGTVKEVHVWTNRPIWPQGGERPKPEECPSSLHWDLWLGPAPKRPYAKGYHPFAWRGWWDFGTGALGDMACHTVNMPYMGLDLKNPTSVVAKSSGHNRDSYPAWSVITFEYPANEWRPALKFFWYDGGKRPADEYFASLEKMQKEHEAAHASQSKPEKKDDKKGKKKDKKPTIGPERSGCLVVGEKGSMYAPGDYGGTPIMLDGAKEVEVNPPKSPGHFAEWVRAIQGGEPAMSNFANYSGGLTETILLGNLAVWAADKGEGKKIEWDAKNLVATNAPEVMHIVKPEFQNGYAI
jgi:predicted dehydrogenase